MVIRRVGVLSAGMMFAALYGLVGLLCGAFLTIISVLGGSSSGMTFMGADIGAFAIVIAPILTFVTGLIGGMIGALIFNLAAGLVGGLRVDVE